MKKNKWRKIRRFFYLSFREKSLVIQIFCLTGLVRLFILRCPFQKIQPYLGTKHEESSRDMSRDGYQFVRKIRWLIEEISPYTPWQSRCLVQAVTAQYLLKKHGLASTLYLGICRSKGCTLKSHAWLRCGSVCVTGGSLKDRYEQIACFSNENKIKFNKRSERYER